MITKKVFKGLIIGLPLLTGVAIETFISGGLVAMPSDFPYSRGVWNAVGVSAILLIMFFVSWLVYLLAKRPLRP